MTTTCAVFWDLENCPIARGVDPSMTARNLRQWLRTIGHIHSCRAYADLSRISSQVREPLQLLGVSLHDVPGHSKEASDKAIIVDMLFFAIDHASPATLILISGDRDFSNTLSRLSDRGYRIVLVYPDESQLSTILSSVADETIAWGDLQSAVPAAHSTPTVAGRNQQMLSPPRVASRPSGKVRQIADDLESSVVHTRILQVLRQTPQGMTTNQLVKATDLFQWLNDHRTDGVNVVSPAAILEQVRGVKATVVDGHKVFSLEEDTYAEIVDELHAWIMTSKESFTLKASQVAEFYGQNQQAAKTVRKLKLRTFVEKYGTDKLVFVPKSGGRDEIITLAPPAQLDALYKRLLSHQLNTASGATFEQLAAWVKGDVVLPQDALLRKVKRPLAIFEAAPSRFHVDSHAHLVYTENFAEQQALFNCAAGQIAELAVRPDGATWSEVKDCLKAVDGLASCAQSRRFVRNGYKGFFDAFITRRILVQPTPFGNFFATPDASSDVGDHISPSAGVLSTPPTQAADESTSQEESSSAHASPSTGTNLLLPRSIATTGDEETVTRQLG